MILKQLRGNKSQKEVAKDLQLTQRTVSSYENGLTEPNIETLIKLANYFDVSLDYLCERPFNNNIGYIPDDKKPAVKKLIELNGVEFEKAEAYITAMLDKTNK